MKVKDLLKTDDIIKVSPEDPLSSVLPQLDSSHDAGFVFDDTNLLGVINPYYCIIKKVYPGHTKAQSCLMHPPKLHLRDDMQKAARLMIESKIHYLPVFKEDNVFAGIISARRILGYMLHNEYFSKDLHKKIGAKKVVTIIKEDSISKALNLFKENKISKLVMVNGRGILAGIISQYDVADLVSLPRERRGSSTGGGDKDAQLGKPVRNFGHVRVETLTEKATYADALGLILEKKIGSIVVVDSKRKPIGIVTIKDVLTFMVTPKDRMGVEISLHDLQPTDEKDLSRALKSIEAQLQKYKIGGGHLVARGKHGGGVYVVTFSCVDNQGYVSIHLEGKHFKDMLTELIDKLGSRLDH